MVRKQTVKNMRGGVSEPEQATIPIETKSFSNGATDPSEDAANAANASNDKLAELNQLSGGAYRHRIRGLKMRGGSDEPPPGQMKAVTVDSPIREVTTGPFGTANQVTENQITINQGMADTKYDNVQGGGVQKKKRYISKSRKLMSRRKSKMNRAKRARKTFKKHGNRMNRKARVTKRR